TPPPPTSPLLPYTTLFRSGERLPHHLDVADALEGEVDAAPSHLDHRLGDARHRGGIEDVGRPQLPRHGELPRVRVETDDAAGARSEEHTSELQSRGHLVCR